MKYTLFFLFLYSLTANAQWQKINTGSSKDLYDIHFSGGKGYIAGHNSALLKSTDSGKSWSSLTLSIPSNLRAVHFISPDTGFVTGENARIQKTYNGGINWTQKYVRTAAYAYDIQFSGRYGLAVGKDMLAVSSRDFGETWTVDTTPKVSKALNSVCIGADSMCWAVGDSGFLLRKHLRDLGWSTVLSGTNVNLNSIRSVSPAVLIACGGMPDTSIVGKYYNVILKSSDSGKTWQQTSASELKTITASFFIESDTGFFIGSNGIISRTYDGFSQRAQQLSGTASTLNGIDRCGPAVFICGDGGTLLKTLNRGGYGLGLTHSKQQGFRLYPQPCRGKTLQFQCSGTVAEITLFDMQGRPAVFTYNAAKGSLEIPFAGSYYIRIIDTDGRIYTSRLVTE